jgi:uncharacterized protein YbjT (DUF2867 family)
VNKSCVIDREAQPDGVEMILITGAAGLCGSAAVHEFSRRAQRVRALVRRPLSTPAPPSVEIVEGDMSRRESLGAALDGVTTALLISSSNAQMVDTQCRFIDAAKAHGVERIVKLSGAESGIGFDSTKFRFTRMHEEIERHLEASGLCWTHMRPSQFMQVYLREAPTIASTGTLRLPFEDIELSPIDVRDIAGVAHALLCDEGHANGRLDMTGPEALTMTAIATQIATAIDRPVRYVNISLEERRAAFLSSGAPSTFADAMDEQARERLKHPKSRVDVDAQKQSGIEPTSFSDFVARHKHVFLGLM